jgi:hypothetical protein
LFPVRSAGILHSSHEIKINIKPTEAYHLHHRTMYWILSSLFAVLAIFLLLHLLLYIVLFLFPDVNPERCSGAFSSGKCELYHPVTEQQPYTAFDKLDAKMTKLGVVNEEESRSLSPSATAQIKVSLNNHFASFDSIKRMSLNEHFNPLTSSFEAQRELGVSIGSLRGKMKAILPLSESGKVEAAWMEYWEEFEGAQRDLL